MKKYFLCFFLPAIVVLLGFLGIDEIAEPFFRRFYSDFWIFFARFGSMKVLMIASLAVWTVLKLAERASPATHRLSRPALNAFLSMILSSAVIAPLKFLVGRMRPEFGHAFMPFQLDNVFHSFPSGHAGATFALMTSVALACPKFRWPALALAFVAAASRLFMSAHWLSDVVAGALIGTVAARYVVIAGAAWRRRSDRAVPLSSIGMIAKSNSASSSRGRD